MYNVETLYIFNDSGVVYFRYRKMSSVRDRRVWNTERFLPFIKVTWVLLFESIIFVPDSFWIVEYLFILQKFWLYPTYTRQP